MNIMLKNEGGILQAECCDLEQWKDGERLLLYLKQQFGVHVDDQAEGPDARRWFVIIKNKKLLIDQSDLGFLNISGMDAGGNEAVQCIAKHLQTISTADFMKATETPLGRVFRAFKRS